MAAPNLSELVTTTLRKRSKKLADNVSENNGLLKKLKMAGKVRPFDGGREIVEELDYAENQTHKWYSGYENLDISPSEVLSAATYSIKQSMVAVTMSGLEQLQNAGDSQSIDLLAGRITNAERTIANNIAEGLWSDGTGSNGKTINGIQGKISNSPTTGTEGNINRANFTFWRNQTETGTTVTQNNIREQMRKLWVKQVRGMDKPDLIVMDNNFYQFFWGEFQERQRFTNAGSGGRNSLAKYGYDVLQWNTADVILDGGIGGNCPDNRAYFLNCDYLWFRPHRRRNMVPLERTGEPVDQDAMVKYIVFAGNLTMSNAMLQGVLTN